MPTTLTSTPAVICAARNPIVYQLQAPEDWADIEGYSVSMKIEYEQTYRGEDTVVLLDNIILSPNEDGLIVVDIQEAVQALVSPTLPTGNMGIDKSANARYICTFTATDATLVDTWRHVVWAGFPIVKGQYLYDWVITDKKFLSNQPQNRRVHACTPMYAYGIARPQDSIAIIRVDVEKADGSKTGLTYLGSIINPVEGWDLLYFGVGFEQMNLHLFPDAEDIVAWEVQMSNQAGEVICNTQRFYLDQNYYNPNIRHFAFNNAVGGWDSFYTTGEAKTAPNFSKETSQLVRSPLANHKARGKKDWGASYNYAITQNIGFLDQNEQEWLQDLWLSEDVYRIGETRHPNPDAEGKWMPINVQGGSIPFFEDNVFIQTPEFSYTEAHNERG